MNKTLTLVALLSSLALSSFASEQTRMQAQMQNRAETMQGQAQMQNRAQTMRPQVQAQMQNRTQTRMQENASTTMRSGRPN